MYRDDFDGNGCRGILSALGIVALVSILVLLAVKATASPHDKTDIDVTVEAESKAMSRSASTAKSKSKSSSAAASDSESVSAASNGDMLSTNSSQFYALSLMFPGASDCFTGAQGGANDTDADNGVSAFLGIHILNTSCWLDKLASQESDIVLNARLKCGDKKYRNAIAYDAPKKERQATCISMKVASGNSQMYSYKNTMQELLDKANEDKKILLELRDHDRQVCDESIERCQERLQK